MVTTFQSQHAQISGSKVALENAEFPLLSLGFTGRLTETPKALKYPLNVRKYIKHCLIATPLGRLGVHARHRLRSLLYSPFQVQSLYATGTEDKPDFASQQLLQSAEPACTDSTSTRFAFSPATGKQL